MIPTPIARLALTLRQFRFVIVAAAVLALSGGAASAWRPAQSPARPAAPDAGVVARGEYLANRVAMCVQCHSGRDEHGEIIEAEKFRGGAIPVTSPYPNRPFAYRAPNIERLSGLSDEQVITLLVEGQATGRRAPSAPMPPFRMARADAEAIVAYLRSR